MRSTTLRPIVPRETKVEAGPSRPYTRSIARAKPGIVIEIPRKTTDYYRDFHEIEKALLVDDDKENHLILLTNLSNEPSTYKQAVQGPCRKDWLRSIEEEIAKLEAQEC